MSAHKISNTALGGAMVFSITKARGLFHEDYVLMLHNLRKANIARQRSCSRHSNKIYAVPKICFYPMSDIPPGILPIWRRLFSGGGDPGILEGGGGTSHAKFFCTKGAQKMKIRVPNKRFPGIPC